VGRDHCTLLSEGQAWTSSDGDREVAADVPSIDLVQLSDPRTEDAIYDSYAMRKFTGLNFLTESVPDETTLCKFRHLLKEHGLNKLFFDAINGIMEKSGHMLKGGTVVDATIINTPSSTKNAQKARDPEMHQTKKGNEWRFGMKCHVGVDAFSGLFIR